MKKTRTFPPTLWIPGGALILVLAAGPLSAPAHVSEPSPILVTGMVHMDPFLTLPDTNQTLQNYQPHREAFLWYVNYADSAGLRLSAQMTGVYAEACVRQDNAADLASFMPLGRHHLGTHIHANVKTPIAYRWRLIPPGSHSNPDSCRLVMSDNFPWVNQVFVANGFSSADNYFFHGSRRCAKLSW